MSRTSVVHEYNAEAVPEKADGNGLNKDQCYDEPLDCPVFGANRQQRNGRYATNGQAVKYLSELHRAA